MDDNLISNWKGFDKPEISFMNNNYELDNIAERQGREEWKGMGGKIAIRTAGQVQIWSRNDDPEIIRFFVLLPKKALKKQQSCLITTNTSKKENWIIQA